jgi:hypothetical protein
MVNYLVWHVLYIFKATILETKLFKVEKLVTFSQLEFSGIERNSYNRKIIN